MTQFYFVVKLWPSVLPKILSNDNPFYRSFDFIYWLLSFQFFFLSLHFFIEYPVFPFLYLLTVCLWSLGVNTRVFSFVLRFLWTYFLWILYLECYQGHAPSWPLLQCWSFSVEMCSCLRFCIRSWASGTRSFIKFVVLGEFVHLFLSPCFWCNV